MFVGVHVESGVRRAQRFLDLECDYCGAPFERKYSALGVEQLEHFCSGLCSQRAHRQLCVVARVRPDVVAKQQATVQARFGVKSVLALPEIHALANTPEKCRQRHETMRDNGSYFNSKSEDKFYDLLVVLYGLENVQRQFVINKWPIDFYVQTTDTYVQFDGEYWHGLDRPLTEIMKFKTPRDKTILRKHQIDREQDNWFRDNDKRLVRITDKQFQRGQLGELEPGAQR